MPANLQDDLAGEGDSYDQNVIRQVSQEVEPQLNQNIPGSKRQKGLHSLRTPLLGLELN